MRRRTLLGTATLIALSGCSPRGGQPGAPTSSTPTPTTTEPSTPPSDRIERLKQEALALTKGMIDGDPQPIIDRGTEQLRQAADAAALADAWRQVSEPKGPVVGLAGAGLLTQQGDQTVIVVLIDLEQGRLVTQYAFDGQDRLAGFHFRDPLPADEAAVTGPTRSEEPTEYEAEAVSVGEHSLTGEYVTPAPGVTTRPVTAILLGGSGPTDKDGTVGSTHILKDLAAGLAAAGISSLRYNKRYLEQPNSDGAMTLATEVLDDAAAALDLVAGLPGSSGHRVVVIGHSLGGMLVPHLLASHADVAGGVILAGSPRHLADILHDQLVARLGDGEDAEAERERLASEVAAAKAATGGEEQILGVSGTYWESVTRIHGSLAQDLATAGDPILILHGGDDGQLPAATDHEPWAEVASGPTVERRLFEGLNHLLMPTADTQGNLDYVTPNHLDPQVVAAISDWVQCHVEG